MSDKEGHDGALSAHASQLRLTSTAHSYRDHTYREPHTSNMPIRSDRTAAVTYQRAHCYASEAVHSAQDKDAQRMRSAGILGQKCAPLGPMLMRVGSTVISSG